MSTAPSFDEFERVVARRGPRSGVPIIVAVHSTARGPAIGGCRLATYPDWRAGLTDALRLSAAMTAKCAVAGLPHGGGKTVVALSPGTRLSPDLRHAILHDIGDTVESLHGEYATGPDVGTGPADMAVIADRTRHVFCRPAGSDSSEPTGQESRSAGSGDFSGPTARETRPAGSGDAARPTVARPRPAGSGDSSGPTAQGVLAALGALGAVGGRRFAVQGLGRVGSIVARGLAEAGATVLVTDVDERRRALADEIGAVWTGDVLTADVDVLVPAALGGILTAATVPRLRCGAICGPANNQLDEPATAELIHERGILWAPDFVVSAGGVIHATGVELRGETAAQAAERVRGIAATLTAVLDDARRTGVTPLAAAYERARQATMTP
jgi:glutamate dehydrogenase/leucine dehydrogenase